ncbi:sodium:proton antiporter [Synechococcus sp. RSCCF101]|uniref:Na+/H+ antiporter subunit E n=1 Tax=Synechococcus sp. RSCCF101 TaxID=2511069 RepID=UPI001245C9CF|nr:Na+/H+ antiporter subunit E [Synechococcus sp. RSCCF101]QEY31200.1 sodium:proton antiporter [Synechococcus sp. RSCCF101]
MNSAITLSIGLAIRLLFWCLLTADVGPANLAIGLALAALLPRSRRPAPSPRALVHAFWDSLVAIPQAYAEAFALMAFPHHRASHEVQPLSGEHHPLIVFLEVFRVTLTPFTIALGVTSSPEALRIHRLMPRRLSSPSQRPDR